ncbi:HAD family phosphatase [Candidatus Campbellbacteria bacterium]|nr:MAG: HAD family phosphatase [Candidatus Campbellbacteria bacterium]
MFKKENIKAVLFDMDGTLTNTEPLGIEVMKTCLGEIGVQISEEEWVLFDKVWRRDGTEMTTEEFIHQILGSYASNTNEEEFTKSFYDSYEGAIIRASLLPGAKELLGKLKGKYLTALVTASNQSQTQKVLKEHDWQDAFTAVVTQDEYKTKKPDPASFLMAANRLGVSPESCVVIEDSKNGSRAGKNAGMYVIGVRAGNEHPQDLSAADMIVETLIELHEKF